MQKFFDQYRKIIVPCSGIILFLVTGAFAMFLTSPKAVKPVKAVPVQQVQTQVQEVRETPTPEIHEAESKPPQPQEKPKGEDWFVYVTGAVNKPGVYKLPDNPRIFHAIEAAGGMTPKADQTSLNLAEKILADGLHIHVEARAEREAREAKLAKQERESRAAARVNLPQQAPVNVNNIQVPGVPANSRNNQAQQTSNTGLVDVNHASEQELTRLKGVGPAIAKRIVDFRNNMGSFKTPEDLLQVRGIGPKTLEKMRPQILIR